MMAIVRDEKLGYRSTEDLAKALWAIRKELKFLLKEKCDQQRSRRNS
jgi:hypothetical protein